MIPTPTEIRVLANSRTKTSKRDLKRKFPRLRLKAFLDTVPRSTKFRSFMPKSFTYLNEELASMPLSLIKDLYLFINLSEKMDAAYPDYYEKKFAMNAKFFGGPKVREEIQERCTIATMESFPMELDYIIVPKMFPNFPRERFVALAEKIRATIIDTLKENKWLSKKGRAGAIKKISTASLYLVTPETESQWNFKPTVAVTKNTPLRNNTKLAYAERLKDFNELGKRIPTDRWEMSPLKVNAYYQPSFNQFVLPIAILQSPFFDAENTVEQNLAAIGSVIGHELGHAIDDMGRRYDYKGRLRDWVTKRDITRLHDRTQPLVKQFDSIGHNGTLTLGENIGDLVGISTSFRAAYPNYTPGKYKADDLQKFYLQFARVWCEVQTPSFAELRLKTDPHSLGKGRINEQMKHQLAFREAFSCNESDPMVLKKNEIIKIW